MLKLNRRLNEIIRIGHDVSIKILKICNGTITIGIAAPKNISVHREEIYQKNEAAKSQHNKPINDAVWHRKVIL